MTSILLLAQLTVMTPGHTGSYEYVPDPTPAKVKALAESGKKPLVVTAEIGHERPALTNWAEYASAVAFEVLPRQHLIYSWKALGIRVLKTVRYEREGSPDRFRRDAGIGAFLGGADGIWIPNAKEMPAEWKTALRQAAEDRAVCDRLAELRAKIEARPRRGRIWIETRRVGHFLGWLDFENENVDAVRLEMVGWAKRLEQLLGETPADLPTTVAPKIAFGGTGFRPYDDLKEKPPQVKLSPKTYSADLGEGVSFAASVEGFSITVAVTNRKDLVAWEKGNRALDVRLYVNNPSKPGDYLPYRYHCDLDPEFMGEREVWEGRGGWAFNADRRFRPASFGYANGFDRLRVWPRLREYGPDYPELVPSMSFSENKKAGTWSVRLSFGWQVLNGRWPGETEGKSDVWYVGLDRSPVTGRPFACRILWPRGNPALHKARLQKLSAGYVAKELKEQEKSVNVWRISSKDRYYPFAKTKTPCFYRGDSESDEMFLTRVVEPFVDSLERYAEVFRVPERKKDLKYGSLSEEGKLAIWDKVPELLSLRRRIGELRAAYLADRYLGKLPPAPPPKKKAVNAAAEAKVPDADIDADSIQLDDKEF